MDYINIVRTQEYARDGGVVNYQEKAFVNQDKQQKYINDWLNKHQSLHIVKQKNYIKIGEGQNWFDICPQFDLTVTKLPLIK